MTQWSRGPVLGRGSSATVSLATSSLSGELIAVKSAELSRSDLLQGEQRILSALNCPQIISYLGFQVTPLHYNLFIEYAPGGPLSDHIKNHNGCLNDVTIRSHTHQILTGLAYLHSNNLVHCDIKPDNILIGSDGQAKIADLGCARWTYHTGDIARYQIRGTPMFMAPEVARGEEQGPAADVWALGCTVLEMATGCPPWPQSDPIATLHEIAFSQVVPEIPSWLSFEGKDFLRNCLVRDPTQRWTVDQLLKHPFGDFSSVKQDLNSSNSSWRSPKSILDFWESESEEEEDKDSTDDYTGDRIRELQGSFHGGPNWTWDESWTTIRSNTEGSPVATASGDDEVGASQISSNSSSTTEDAGTLLLESHNSNQFDYDSDEILESGNENEMMNVKSCKRDLISFTNKSCVSENIHLGVVFGICQSINCRLFNLKYLGTAVRFISFLTGIIQFEYKRNLVCNTAPVKYPLDGVMSQENLTEKVICSVKDCGANEARLFYGHGVMQRFEIIFSAKLISPICDFPSTGPERPSEILAWHFWGAIGLCTR